MSAFDPMPMSTRFFLEPLSTAGVSSGLAGAGSGSLSSLSSSSSASSSVKGGDITKASTGALIDEVQRFRGLLLWLLGVTICMNTF